MFNFSQNTLEIIRTYGYFVMVPLMILEGPLATVVSAFLASLGLFSWPIVWALSMLSDIVSDLGFYEIGKRFGMKFVKGPGKYLGMSEKSIEKAEEHFKKHGGKTVFLAKSTTGFAQITFTTAGLIKMDKKEFLKYVLLGGIIWNTFLVFIGYFYGYLWRNIIDYIRYAGIIIFSLLVITFIIINVFKRFESRKIFDGNNGQEKS